MSVTVGSKITAANYNTLQSRVANILGPGFDQSGYGQPLVSSTVDVDTLITANHMELLRTDLNRICVHQTGSLSNLSELDPGDKISANAVGGDSTKGFNAYIALMNILEPNAQVVDPTQVTIETAITSVRYSPWNGQPVHSFTVTWTSQDQRRAFFNAGGEIHMSAEIAGDITPKGLDWNSMLSNMGTIKFGKTATTKTGSGGSAYSIGNYQMTSSYQRIFERSGQANVYAENRYFITAKETSTRAIQFRIEFLDADSGDPNVDESIFGTLTSLVKQLRPTGSYVSLTSPSYSNQVDLASGA
jgi:hypothetical protein